jgi:hypothetical protein
MSGRSWQKHNSKRKCRKFWLHTREMRKDRRYLFALKKTFINFVYKNPNSLEPFNLAKEEGEMSVVEQHKRNLKKNHKILKEEDMITIMRKLRNKNKKFM